MTFIEQHYYDISLLSTLRKRLLAGSHLGLVGLISCALISCASSNISKPASAQNRPEAQAIFDGFTETISVIRSNYIAPIDLTALIKAARNGIYKDRTLSKSLNLSLAADSLNGLQEEYFYLLDNHPNLQAKDVIKSAMLGIVDSMYPHLKLVEQVASNAPIAKVGLVLQKINDDVIISSIVKESPAQRLDLKRGDRLLKIDAKILSDLPLEAVIAKLQGLPDSTVRLTIERAGKVSEVIATRTFVNNMPIESSLYSKGIGYIRISRFDSSVKELFSKQISTFGTANSETLKGIVIDLRDNTGGDLRAIVEVADYFLDDGLILSTSGRSEESEMRFLASANANATNSGVKLAVLINGQTAAGSEMLAASFQDHRRATVIGTTSQGYNKLSTVFPMKEEGAMILETGEMTRPSGKLLSQFGVVPNICVSNGVSVTLNPEKYQSPEAIWNACPSETQIRPSDDGDFALQTAVNLLLEKQ
ncbi:S41 family peptidase [Methylomicrobium lacus]|uniref:S41 family peptidase n=1 Tax=Methylomicrobium lacus TaxID=136992 RepID=UPI0035A881E7